MKKVAIPFLILILMAITFSIYSCGSGGSSSGSSSTSTETSTDNNPTTGGSGGDNELSLANEESFSYEVSLPDSSTISKNDLKVSSFVSDEAKILNNDKSSVVMAENSAGATILLGYAFPSNLKNNVINRSIKRSLLRNNSYSLDKVEVSIRSTTLSLIMISMGKIEDETDKANLIKKVLAHSDFNNLQTLIETEWKKDVTFLDKLMEFPDIVVQIKKIAKDVYNEYLNSIQTSNNMRYNRVAGAEQTFWWGSPWDKYEPWKWYGTAGLAKVWEPPFVGISTKSNVPNNKKYAIGNPTNISYLADFYDASTGSFLDWRFIGRNSTMLQKTRNSGAALSYLQDDLNFTINPSKDYTVKIKKCWLSGKDEGRHWMVFCSHLFHITGTALNLIADGSLFKECATALTLKNVVKEISQDIIRLTSSLNLSEGVFTTSNISSVIETTYNIFLNETVLRALGKTIQSNAKSKVAKMITKLTAKLSNPVGWAVILIDAANDFVPFTTSILSAPSEVIYTVNFGDYKVDEGEKKIVQLQKATLTAPKNNTTISKTSTYFIWDGNGESYDFYFGESSSNLQKQNSSDLTEKQYQVTGLQNNKTYYWKIVSKKPSTTSTSSDIYSFSVKDNNIYNKIVAEGVENDRNALVSPNGGEIWNNGDTQTVYWMTQYITGTSVDLYVLHDDPSGLFDKQNQNIGYTINSKSWFRFAIAVPNNGSYTLDPSNMAGTGNAYMVLVVSTEDNSKFDISDGTFSLNYQ